MKHDGIKSIAVNASYIFASFGFTGLVRGIYAIILARLLGPEIYGLFNYGLSWYLVFLPITILGLNVFLAREIGSRRPGYEKFVGRTLALRSITSILVAICCGLVGWFIEAESVIRQLIIIFSLALFGRGLALWTNSVFVAFEKSQYSFQQDALFRVLEIIVGVTVLINGGGVLALAIVHAGAWWLQGFRGVMLVRKHLLQVRADWDFRELASLVYNAIPFLFLNLFGAWLLQGPLVLYRHLADMDANLGQLALALQALFLLSGIPWSLSQAVLPVLSRAVDRDDGKDKVFVEGMLRIGIIFGAIAGLAGMALGPWFVPLVFSDRYMHAGDLLGPAFWVMVPMIWGSTLAQVVIARDQLKVAVLCSLCSVTIFLLSFPFLVQRLGTYGAISAAGLGYLVLSLGYILVVHRMDRLNLNRTLFRPVLSVILALLTYFALLPFGVLLALVVSIVAMLSAVLITGVLTKQEKQEILKLVNFRK